MLELNIGLSLFAAMVTLSLLLGCLLDSNRDRTFMKIFIRLLAAHFFMLLGETGASWFAGPPGNALAVRLCALLPYGCGYLAVAANAYGLTAFLRERTKAPATVARVVAGGCAVLAVLAAATCFSGLLFTVDGKCGIVYTRVYIFVNLAECLMILLEAGLVLHCRRGLTVKGALALLSSCVLPLVSLLLRYFWSFIPLYLITTLSLIMIYTLFYSELSRQLAEKEVQLTESRISIMLSQIQPHFLYNSLVSIRSLCRRDPEQAWEALGDFSAYLRGNMDTLTSRAPISFSKEFQHIETYLKLEKLRFGNKLEIVYGIEEANFSIPPLTVQPLVENAVKHGVMNKRGGGTVTLRTRREGGLILITVEDTGAGFDPNKLPADGASHVGIQNVRSRLRMMADGDLKIESTPGKGTTATILLRIG